MFQLKRTIFGNPNTKSRFSRSQDLVMGSAGYPEPHEGMPVKALENFPLDDMKGYDEGIDMFDNFSGVGRRLSGVQVEKDERFCIPGSLSCKASATI